MTLYECAECSGTGGRHGCPKHSDWGLGQAREMVWPKLEVVKMVPHRCPVCEGRKTVDPGFYTGGGFTEGTNRETCQTCQGAGILWS